MNYHVLPIPKYTQGGVLSRAGLYALCLLTCVSTFDALSPMQ